MFSWRELPNRLVVIAHRGSSSTAPENTLAAFEQAITSGADAIELDARLSADDNVVVFHDYRLERTTNGKGRVRSYPLTGLKSFTAGYWFSERYNDEKIPTLEEVFELVQGKVGINIELKSANRQEGKLLLEKALRLIKRHRIAKTVMISSFDHSIVRNVKSTDPSIVTGVLYMPLRYMHLSPVGQTKSAQAQFFICSKSRLRGKLVTKLHKSGCFTGIYTVNTQEALDKAYRYGVDCIFTDNPTYIVGLKRQKYHKIPRLGD